MLLKFDHVRCKLRLCLNRFFPKICDVDAALLIEVKFTDILLFFPFSIFITTVFTQLQILDFFETIGQVSLANADGTGLFSILISIIIDIRDAPSLLRSDRLGDREDFIDNPAEILLFLERPILLIFDPFATPPF